MTNIPANIREFESWFIEVSPRWPVGLQALGQRGLLTLRSLDQPAAAQSPAFMAASRADLMAFAEAYGAWAAREQG